MTVIGSRVRRVEDPRLIQGRGQYVGDITPPGLLHAGLVRSPHAHARITGIDVSAARAMPGVAAAYTNADLPELQKPRPVRPVPDGLKGHGFELLCRDTVRQVGDPVVVVLAEDPYILADALEAVTIDYEPLPAIVDVEEALGSDVTVWDDAPGNVAAEFDAGFGDMDAAFENADVVVEGRFVFARAACASIETRSVLAAPGEGRTLTIWDSTQVSHPVRDTVAQYFELPKESVHVIAPDVGGGFGPKGRIYPEELIVAGLALRHNRPVRWVGTRHEDFLTTGQGRGQVHHARLAARSDGTILGLEDTILQDVGAYTPSGVIVPFNTVRHLVGPYLLPALRAHVTGVYTNKAISSTLRGGGRPQGIYVIERMLDRLARRLGIDRAEIRRRNLIPFEAFPHDTGLQMSGAPVIYDSGNYPAYLDRLLETAGYEEFLRRQKQARADGRYLGFGLVTFIESTGTGAEGSTIRLDEEGEVHVAVGSSDQGQGHATAFAQVAAERLGVPFEQVRVVSGDTGAFPWGTGTFASRMGIYGGNAVSLASRALREKVLQIAASMLEIAPQDLMLEDGVVSVRGVPERTLGFQEIAAEAARRGIALEATQSFEPERQSSYAGGASAAIVEVDVETGAVTVERYFVVHDSGTLLNPTIVEGQVHGGVIHGIGNALYDACVYDDSGQLVTATFADYDLPGPGEMPPMEIAHFETPSPFNPEGVKGAGEGGTIAAIPTIVSAVEDALAPFGVEVSDVPISREGLVRAIRRVQ